MKAFAIAISLASMTLAAQADQVLEEKSLESFSACSLMLGLVSADLRAKGVEVKQIIFSPDERIAVSKAFSGSTSVMMICEGTTFKSVLVQ